MSQSPRRRSSGDSSDEPTSELLELQKHYQPGTVIADKFQLVSRVGHGGMGTVWSAKNLVLDVQVAVKIIPIKKRKSAKDLAQRVLEEARTAARIGHPAIVRTLDFGQTEFGDPFIAMEHLTGDDLADMMGDGRKFSAIETVQIILPIAHALGVAHAKGIVHRDVKPENIFIAAEEDGRTQPKLLDFGIARFVNTPRKLTVEGAVLGTPDYMSPQQARGDSTTSATDIWSLSVVIYELLTRRCPFDGENYNSLLRSIIEDTPKPITELGIADPDLWAIIETGLRKNAQERWPSMRDMGDALALWLEDKGVTADVTGTSLRTVWLKDSSDSRMEVPAPRQRFTTGSRPSLDSASSYRDLNPPNESGKRPLVRPQSDSGVELPPASVSGRESVGEQDLAKLAELSSGGDPVSLVEREARKTTLKIALTFVVLIAILVGAVLIGTGIVKF